MRPQTRAAAIVLAVLVLVVVAALLATRSQTPLAVAPSASAQPTLATTTPSATTVASQAPTSAPTDAVRLLLPGQPSSPCYSTDASQLFLRSRGCPVTQRLQDRLRSDAARGFNPICRCQSAAPIDVGAASTSGTTATVPVTFRTPTPYVITFALIQEGQAWLVDDTYCVSDRSTSIYTNPIPTCGG